MEMSDTFFAAIHSVGTASTLAAAGVYLHRRGMVSQETTTVLARYSQQIAIPALFFSKIVDCPQNETHDKCPNVLDHLSDAWVLLLWPCYVVGCGLLVGSVVVRIANTPIWQRRSILAAIAFANSSGLPITLLAVIQHNFESHGQTTIDPNLFLSIYLTVYPILQWGVGGWLLAADEEVSQKHSIPHVVGLQRKCSDLEIASKLVKELSLTNLVDLRRRIIEESAEEQDYLIPNYQEGKEQDYLMPTYQEGKEQDYLIPTYQEGTFASPENYATVPGSSVPTVTEEDVAPLMETAWKIVSKSFQPPVIGAISGLVVVAFAPLRGLFVDLRDRDDDAILEWLFDGILLIGRSAVPVNMAVLGVNLSIASQSKASTAPVNAKTVAAVVIGKMVVMPIIGVLTALFMDAYVWNIPESIHFSFYLVTMIVFITPTANNVMVMIDISGSNAREGIARIIGWQYVVAPLFLSLSVMMVVWVASGRLHT
jgi:predicted permease